MTRVTFTADQLRTIDEAIRVLREHREGGLVGRLEAIFDYNKRKIADRAAAEQAAAMMPDATPTPPGGGHP